MALASFCAAGFVLGVFFDLFALVFVMMVAVPCAFLVCADSGMVSAAHGKRPDDSAAIGICGRFGDAPAWIGLTGRPPERADEAAQALIKYVEHQ